MTRRTSRSPRDLAMWQDPNESPAVRQLLRAGRVDRVEYDVERGLAQHLANLQASAPVPSWAARASLQKSAFSALWAWLVPPVVSVVALGGWMYSRNAEPELSAAPPALSAANTAVQDASTSAARDATSTHLVDPLAPVAAQADSSSSRILALEAHPSGDLAKRGTAVLRHGTSARHARMSRAELRRSQLGAPAQASTTASDGTGAPAEAPLELVSTDYDAPAVSSHPSAAHSHNAASNPRDEAAATEPAKPEVAARAEPVPVPAPVNEARLEREMQMLAVAQRVLRADPQRALRLTRQGEQEFRHSMFSAERKQVSLLALVQLGQLDEARRLGVPFLRAYPNAPWSARLREALVTGHLPAP